MAQGYLGPPRDGAGNWSDPADHKSSFVTSNGVRLHYLDWGGSGPALILTHGANENPHYFDDLAPAFAGQFTRPRAATAPLELESHRVRPAASMWLRTVR
jgi:hypothetical protein